MKVCVATSNAAVHTPARVTITISAGHDNRSVAVSTAARSQSAPRPQCAPRISGSRATRSMRAASRGVTTRTGANCKEVTMPTCAEGTSSTEMAISGTATAIVWRGVARASGSPRTG